ncbi:hypothetical protein ACFQ0X_43310 [Streptomyces rectiviolaceus]|uniref:hypothetical protein n=1 Tax=Streptomyces rectiviolaceus TaxID=332591 RepID=UPI0031CFC727
MSVLLVALIVVVAPHHLLAWDTAGARVPDRAKAINDIRTTLPNHAGAKGKPLYYMGDSA